MRITATILALVVTGTLLAAPVPPQRRKPPPVPVPGLWVLSWAGMDAKVALAKDGGYRCYWGGGEWYGSWAWDEKNRTLYVHETKDGQTWLQWSVQLNETMTGKAVVGDRGTAVSLRLATEQTRTLSNR